MGFKVGGRKAWGTGAYKVWSLSGGAAPAATYASTVLATGGLISFWRLNETSGTNAADQKAVNTGTYVSTPTLNQAGATTDGDKAILLAGASYVLLKSGTITGALANSSMEMWVKIASTPSEYPAIYCERALTGNDIHRLILMASGEAANVRGRLAFQHTDDAGTADTFICTAGTSVTDNAWHQVVFTKAGTTLRIYVDASEQPGSPFTITGNDTLTNAGLETRAGSDKADPSVTLGDQVAALVDDISVYNVTLSAATITAHYAAR